MRPHLELMKYEKSLLLLEGGGFDEWSNGWALLGVVGVFIVEIVEICGGDSEYDSMVGDDGGWGWKVIIGWFMRGRNLLDLVSKA